MSIIGSSQLILLPYMAAALSSLSFLSPDSRCYSFDDRANGYARGEGVSVMVLKPLADAIRDGDVIRAIIRGSGTNQDGQSFRYHWNGHLEVHLAKLDCRRQNTRNHSAKLCRSSCPDPFHLRCSRARLH